MARKRTVHSPQFKAKVALEAAREHYTISELARKYSLHPNLIRGWKKQLVEHLPELFQRPGSRTAKEDETALIPELLPADRPPSGGVGVAEKKTPISR